MSSGPIDASICLAIAIFVISYSTDICLSYIFDMISSIPFYTSAVDGSSIFVSRNLNA